MAKIEKVGLLLVTLGTPDSPSPSDVRPYLREFLSDPRVLDIPAWKRWLVLNLFILPFRPKESGHAYSQIWTEQGSPLLLHGIGLPPDLFTPTFAVARVGGWTAHVLEQIAEDRLIRPRVVYAGARNRRFTPIASRA